MPICRTMMASVACKQREKHEKKALYCIFAVILHSENKKKQKRIRK